MKLAEVSIKRPVFATMMIACIVVFGVVLYKKLTVDLFPEVTFPIVTVTVVYPGADPETMESQVADPIEEAVNSLSGIRTLRSASLESVAQVFIEFELGVDIDVATQDARDRIATIQADLPEGAELPLVQKLDLGALPIMQLALASPSDPLTLARYAEDTLKPALERIPGVGLVDLVGGREREMHVWIDPAAMRSYGMTIQDVVNALRMQNIELPGGRIARGNQELVVRTTAKAHTADDLAAMALTTVNGNVIHLSDVAVVEDSLEEQRSLAFVNDRSAIAVVIQKQSDANTVHVAERVAKALPDIQRHAPEGTQIDILLDNSKKIRASIDTVQLDLVLGALLAVAIIFLFLRDPQATIISALALPTSVIGTFGFIRAMGFTLNMMTTLALSLSIGILIDDAIVVIENIVRRRTLLKENAMDAANRGTAEIGLAVLATTLSIVAVFIPVAFMEGMVGQFFYEFGLTVAFAVMLSLFVSFTLTPMLSARFLRAHHAHAAGDHGLSARIENMLTRTEEGYRRMIGWALHNRWKTLGIAIATLVITFMLLPFVGFEFMPIEDTSQFLVKMELPAGTTLQETAARAEQAATRIRTMPGVISTFTTIGGGVQEKVNTGDIIVTLVPKHERNYGQIAAMSHTRGLLAHEPNLLVSVEPIQLINQGGSTAMIQLDLSGRDLAKMTDVATRIANKLRQAGGYVDVDITYRAGKPELDVKVDRARLDDLGLAGAQIATTVRSLVNGEVATQFESKGERYDVRVQLPEALRTSRQAIERAQVRTPTGQLVEIGATATISEGTGPSQIDRQARQRKVTVLANLDGKVLGDALAEIRAIIATEMPTDGSVGYAFGGPGQMLEESMRNMLVSLFLAIICVYMILAAQFESFVHPFTIMTSLPFALVGAFGGLLITGKAMSIFAMIGLIMLMGLVTKNAILLIDFAIQRRAQGEPIFQALENAGATRLRPILMTTAAMIFGMMPVAIGHGDGGEVRAPMGVVVIGGLITSTLLTLIVVPVIYTLMDGLIVRSTTFVNALFARKNITSQP